jgi:hypothetical protein
MAITEIRDYCIWAKHLRGDARLVEKVLSMRPGEEIELSVDGIVGRWSKMAESAAGVPTPGLRPVAQMKTVWGVLYRDRRGEEIVVDVVQHGSRGSIHNELLQPPTLSDPKERRAALQALFDMAKGARSDGPYGPRDELYDR